jgi:hypothetical protein
MRTPQFALTGLIVIVVAASARAAFAQQPDIIHRAVAREARRVTAEAPIVDAQPVDGRADSDWSRVKKLGHGRDLIVGRRGRAASTLTLLWSDEAGITVVNLAGVPQRARHDLLAAAARYREDPAAPRKSTFEGVVQIAPDGVFVDGQRIGQPGDIIETIPRQDVTEITVKQVDVPLKALAGAAGAVGGFFAGAYLGALVEPACRCDDPGLKGMIIGAPIGAVLGGIAGATAIKSRDEVIYRAVSRPSTASE